MVTLQQLVFRASYVFCSAIFTRQCCFCCWAVNGDDWTGCLTAQYGFLGGPADSMQTVKLWGCVSVRGEWTRLAALSCRSLTPTFHSSHPGLSATLYLLCDCSSWGLCAKSVFSRPRASSCSFWKSSHDWSSHAFCAWHMIACLQTHSF